MNPSPSVEQALRLPLRELPLTQPLLWLRRGLNDFRACPFPGLVHGFLMWAFGISLFTLAGGYFWLLAGAFSGFLLVAPVVATGLYAVSRERAMGGRPKLSTALRQWQPRHRALVAFGVLLALAGTGWVLTSAALITAFSPSPVQSPEDFLRLVVLARQGWLFELWLLLGAVLAAPVFASSVVSIPLLLDRKVGVWTAVLTSWRVVLLQPGLMAVWAGLIMLLTGLAMLPMLVGLIPILPVLAHASWHAYTDLVDVSSLERAD
jgi:uncharacterized membrane protein